MKGAEEIKRVSVDIEAVEEEEDDEHRRFFD